MSTQFVNELKPEFLGIQAINPTAACDSSSRAQMHTSHFSQRIVLNKMDEKILISGVEKKLSPYTFNIKMPENGRIFRIIHKYDPKGSINIRGKQHTNTIVIYQREKDGVFDYFEIPYFLSNHQIFGFKYVPNGKNLAKIQPNSYIEKGTIFADAPTVSEDGTYDYGINTNVAFMSMKAVAEDGFIVSDRYMQRHAFKIQERRSIGIGKDSYLINLYGKTATEFQPIPGLGEKVREDGLLAVTRKYNKELNPVEMSIFDMQEINYTFDKSMYVKAGGGRVIDITVVRNNEAVKYLPTEISGFLDKYADAYLEYNKRIYDAYIDIKKETRSKTGKEIADIDPKLHTLVVDAMSICNIDVHKVRQPLKILYRKQPIDEYHIDITVEHDIIPDIAGFKLTDTHGSKGVICKVVPWQTMPRDKNGIYADIITDSASVIARMNLGRMYEHQIAGAARDVSYRMRKIIGSEKTSQAKLMAMDDSIINELWRQLLEINSCIDGNQYRLYQTLTDKADKCEVLEDSINTYVKLLLPVDHTKSIKQISIDVEKVVKPTFDRVTFNDFETGEEMLSENKIRIGLSYFMLLNKIADDGSSVAIAKQQHYGVLTSSTKHDKHSNAWRNTPVRTDGESEVRIKVGYAGEELQAETMDMSNSSMTQREIYNNILIAEKPSNIPRVIDRSKFPLGTSRPIQNIKHSLMVAGLRIESVPDQDIISK